MKNYIFSPGMRNGFPWLIPKYDQHGAPFQEWDGSTLFHWDGWWTDSGDAGGDPIGGIGGGPGSGGGAGSNPEWHPPGDAPSASEHEYIPVYGDNSLFCLKFTPAQLQEFLWRSRAMEISLESDSMNGVLSASASVDGGYYTADDPPDPRGDWVQTYTWHPTSAEAGISADLSPGNPTIDRLDRGKYFNYDDWALEDQAVWRMLDDGTLSFRQSGKVMNYGGGDILSEGENLSATLASTDDSVAFGSGSDGTGSGSEVNVARIGGTGFSGFLLTMPKGRNLVTGNLIQDPDGNYWWCPGYAGVAMGATATGDFTTEGDGGPDGDVHHGTYSKMAWIDQTSADPETSAPDGSELYGPGAYTTEVGGFFPFKVVLLSGEVITGTAYGRRSTAEIDNSDGMSVSMDVNIDAIPTVVLTVTEDWEYDDEP